MTECITCYEQDEQLCEDQMCLRTGCRLRNKRLTDELYTSFKLDSAPAMTSARPMSDEAIKRYPQDGGSHREAFIEGAKWAAPCFDNTAVTDAVCEIALEAYALDRIQGFSYKHRHVIRDVFLPFDQQELWSTPVAGPDEYQAFQRQCRIERMRYVLNAAFAAVSRPHHSPLENKGD